VKTLTVFLKGGFPDVNDYENRRHLMFVRVREFGEAHSADFAASSLGRQLFADLSALITQIDSQAATEASTRGQARQQTQSRSHSRAALREDLEAISRTARAMADVDPGLEDKFRVPRGNNDQLLLNAARAFRADAAPLADRFIQHEMPEDFLADLDGDIAAMETAIGNQASHVSGHVSARAAVDDSIAQGVDIVRKLDVIVRNKFSSNPAVLAEWTSASHTERSPRRTQPSAPPPSQPTT
jgi:hypothetical protein